MHYCLVGIWKATANRSSPKISRVYVLLVAVNGACNYAIIKTVSYNHLHIHLYWLAVAVNE